MLVIYLHSDISKGFGGISQPCKPYQYTAANRDPSTTPITTGIGLDATQPRSTGAGTRAIHGSPVSVVGPMALVTTYIKTLISQLIHMVCWPGTNATQPRQEDQTGTGRPHPPSGGSVEGNAAVAPQKFPTKNLSLPKNSYDSVYSHIDRRVLQGTVRGDCQLPFMGGNRWSPRYFITHPELMN